MVIVVFELLINITVAVVITVVQDNAHGVIMSSYTP